MNLSFRHATDSDKDFIWKLTCLGYKEAVLAQLGEWDDKFQINHFEGKWPDQGFLVILEGDEDIGAIWAEEEANYFYLREILLLPAFQNQGIGTYLVKEVIENACSKRKPIRLNVLKASRACDLYERLGFRIIDEESVDTHFRMQYDI